MFSTEPGKNIPTTQKIKDKWDNVSNLYDQILTSSTLNLSNNFTQVMNIPYRKNILEMACGNGDYSCDVITQKGPDAKLTAFDLAPKFVGMANAKLQYLDQNYDNY